MTMVNSAQVPPVSNRPRVVEGPASSCTVRADAAPRCVNLRLVPTGPCSGRREVRTIGIFSPRLTIRSCIRRSVSFPTNLDAGQAIPATNHGKDWTPRRESGRAPSRACAARHRPRSPAVDEVSATATVGQAGLQIMLFDCCTAGLFLERFARAVCRRLMTDSGTGCPTYVFARGQPGRPVCAMSARGTLHPTDLDEALGLAADPLAVVGLTPEAGATSFRAKSARSALAQGRGAGAPELGGRFNFPSQSGKRAGLCVTLFHTNGGLNRQASRRPLTSGSHHANHENEDPHRSEEPDRQDDRADHDPGLGHSSHSMEQRHYVRSSPPRFSSCRTR